MLIFLLEYACNLITDMTKGKKRVRGEPVYHDELKKSLNLTVTPTGARGLEEIAQELGLKSKSELVDQIGRRVLIVSPNPAVKQDTEEPAD
jgi:hypothetical protein